MSNIEQCNRCRLNRDTCGCFDYNSDALCEHYVKPIDNSRMFSHWYSFTGRIGRLEYAITLVIAIVLYLLIANVVAMSYLAERIPYMSETQLYIYAFACMIPSAYLAVAAGVKRTHDTRVSPWYSLAPLVLLFYLNIFTLVLVCAGLIYLLKDAGEEGINEYGSNPAQPYDEQVRLDNE